MNIYLVDYLGEHCGMHYYLDAFKKNLSVIPSTEVIILSNYPIDGQQAFFLNQYKGSLIQKIKSLFINYYRFFRFVSLHKKDIVIFLTYGNFVDILFLNLVSKVYKHVIDIHEVIAQHLDNNMFLLKQFKRVYSNSVRNVIVHSKRSADFLNDFGFSNNKFYVPHFKYCFNRNYKLDDIAMDVRNAVVLGKINLLFFGNITYSKGVDVLIESINALESDIVRKINVIIAGKDLDGTIHKTHFNDDISYNLILRHIEDDELIYLYQNIQYVILPYRKTSQSGVLEMSFYFKKPIIASNIPYFNQVLTEFPSFGILSSVDYGISLKEAIRNYSNREYYVKKDYDKYTHRREVEDFMNKFDKWINRE